MAKVKIVKNMIDKYTRIPVREGTILTIDNQKRVKELLDAKVAVELKEGDINEK